MSKKKQQSNSEQTVEQAISSTEQFIEKNKKRLLYTSIGVVSIAVLMFAYQHLYRKPLINEALAQTFVAEQYFRADSFELALRGDGNSLGFEQLIDDYGTKAGDAIYLYAGISELHLANYSDAIAYLKRYNGKDPLLKARALCNIGDAYSALENYKEALNYYLKAANHADNALAAGYLLKAGIVAEELGETPKALEIYQTIKERYPQSVEGYDIDKYIFRLK